MSEVRKADPDAAVSINVHIRPETSITMTGPQKDVNGNYYRLEIGLFSDVCLFIPESEIDRFRSVVRAKRD